MSDIDYFLDMPSSPDPLADDVPTFPSSTRPSSSRRITESRPRLSTPSKLPRTTTRMRSRSQSPRKQTFELDVGDGRSPQRIRVTVEAEEHLKPPHVNRNLFPPSSPTRSARRRETVVATTTTVPLNDEDGAMEEGVGTPRRRGRPRRVSNGTPIPKSRKRAGTPIPKHRPAKQARQEYEPSSEAEPPSDGTADIGGDETPKPKAQTRRTPKKYPTTTAVPSSQISSAGTGRKRGRPRKTPIEDGTSVGIGSHATGAAQDNTSGNAATGLNKRPRRDGATASPLNPGQSREPATTHRVSPSLIPSDSSHPDQDADMMSEDQADGAHSDFQSEADDDEMRFNRQDTIADASDFSMIAVESLPSFQASFHASFHADNGGLPEEDYEMGEETSRIINRTLDSLRRSLRSKTGSPPPATENEHGATGEEDEGDGELLHQSSMARSHTGEMGLSKSPRRPKTVPLSRQVLVGRGNVDDSFSTIPDSILHAATPGRAPTVQTTAGPHAEGDAYNDSFSEIPEAVLAAATPRPSRHIEPSAQESPSTRDGQLHQQVTRSAVRRHSVDYESNRLPTPEQTSSSNAGSKKGHEEEVPERIPGRHGSSPHGQPDVPSSPPARTRPRALDYGQSSLRQELSLVQEHRALSSPPQQAAKVPPNQQQSLEAPPTVVRPSLSPIVRVGRTLQHVMSDNSSPEVRDGSLGSPFRGPANNEQGHQTSIARSLSPSMRAQGRPEKALPATFSTRLDRSLVSDLDENSALLTRGAADAEAHLPSKIGSYSRARDLNEAVRSKLPEGNVPVVNSSDEKAGRSDSGIIQKAYDQAPVQSVDSREQSTYHTGKPNTSELDTAHDTGPEETQDEERRDEGPLPGSDHGSVHESIEEYDDDLDVWDIEASRASPPQAEPPRVAQRPTEPDAPPARRSRIPSPWSKTARRLIYKEQIASSSQIEVEEGSQSSLEQESIVPTVRSGQEAQGTPTQSPSQQLPELPREHTMSAQPRRPKRTSSPTPRDDDLQDYGGPAEAEQSDDLMDFEEDERVPDIGPTGVGRRDQTEAGPRGSQTPVGGDSAMDAAEYSLVSKPEKPASKPLDEPASAKSRFFGKFDLLSFFSSPTPLPTKAPLQPTQTKSVRNPEIAQPALNTREARQTEPKEPPKAIWSTGLFPSVVPQTQLQRSAERRENPLPSGQNLQSSDTIPDTYEPSESVSPSPSPSPSHPGSGAPSTPERQVSPAIQQETDRIPQPGQSRGPLLSRGQRSSSATQSEANDGESPQVESGNEHDESALTEGSEYERIPPREKPSRWDRNLSPTKSAFRSPLKPTTPGRLVSFGDRDKDDDSSRIGVGGGTGGGGLQSNVIAQAPPPLLLRPYENHGSRVRTQQTKTKVSVNDENDDNDHTWERWQRERQQQQQRQQQAPASSRRNHASSSSSSSSSSSAYSSKNNTNNIHTRAPPSLSQTTWSKQHWARLDEMLQLRRHDPQRFRQTFGPLLPPPEKRRSAALLGKEVLVSASRDDDARLVLEPWHLDVVDAFALEVGGGGGGWDERVLAKRLFALVVGEKKRMRGG
ncbi:hypothetical protein F5Y17DRAFT_422679 [Xylariaceae sp. FL0594]|nr:hypothetical protein F5Y17DRAFT_422679 [Xylariaceae sp. FL0594]